MNFLKNQNWGKLITKAVVGILAASITRSIALTGLLAVGAPMSVIGLAVPVVGLVALVVGFEAGGIAYDKVKYGGGLKALLPRKKDPKAPAFATVVKQNSPKLSFLNKITKGFNYKSNKSNAPRTGYENVNDNSTNKPMKIDKKPTFKSIDGGK